MNVFVGLDRNRETYFPPSLSSAGHLYHRRANIGVLYIQGQRSSLTKFIFR